LAGCTNSGAFTPTSILILRNSVPLKGLLGKRTLCSMWRLGVFTSTLLGRIHVEAVSSPSPRSALESLRHGLYSIGWALPSSSTLKPAMILPITRRTLSGLGRANRSISLYSTNAPLADLRSAGRRQGRSDGLIGNPEVSEADSCPQRQGIQAMASGSSPTRVTRCRRRPLWRSN